jgi:hypothetical protein
MLNSKNTRPILSFLLRTNIDSCVDQDKVRELCTALEVEYEYKKVEFADSGVASLIRKLKETVKDYKKEDPGILDDSTYGKPNQKRYRLMVRCVIQLHIPPDLRMQKFQTLNMLVLE